MSDWMSQIGGLLQRYATQPQAQANPQNDFDRLTRHAPQSSLAEGISAAFRSNQTPAFGDMVANLFNNGDSQQKASLLNMLAPIIISQMMGGNRGGSGNILGALLSGGGGPLGALLGGGGGLGGILGALAGGQQVTPEMAEQVSPEEVKVLAQRAEEHDPSIIDTLSNFYAEHPTLVKTLGAVALTIAINQIANRRS